MSASKRDHLSRIKAQTIAIMSASWLWSLAASSVCAEGLQGPLAVGQVVVTATRTPEPLATVPQVVDVIASEEIEATVGETLTEQIKKNSSVDVVEHPGALSGIGIRGFRPEYSGVTKHSLLLIDGRPAGATNLATILTDNIERIEVLKGPASSLYGAEAMGGVVNIITRRSTGPLHGSLEVGGGSYDTCFQKAIAGGRLSPWLDFDMTAQGYDQNGAIVMGNGRHRPATTQGVQQGSLRLGSDLAGKWRLDVKGDWYYGNDIESPGALSLGDIEQDLKDLERFGGDVRLLGAWGRNQSQITVFAARESGRLFPRYDYDYTTWSSVPVEQFLSFHNEITWQGLQAQNTTDWGAGQLVLGLDLQAIEEESRSYNRDGSRKPPWNPDSARRNWGAYTETVGRVLDEELILTAGLRYDIFELETKRTPYRTDFHPGTEDLGALSPRLGGKYLLTPSWCIHSTLGRAFVPPTADQTAGYSERMVGAETMITRGNPGLDPEKGWTWDMGVGFDGRALGLTADLTYFLTEVDDKITRDSRGNVSTYANAAEAGMAGMELGVAWALSKLLGGERSLRLFANGTRLFHAREDLPNTGERDTLNVARWKLNYGLDYEDGLMDGRLLARYVGEAKDYDWNAPGYPVMTYGDFTVVDLSVGLKVKARHRLGLEVSNLFDQYYSEKPDYPLAGRAWYLSYRIGF